MQRLLTLLLFIGITFGLAWQQQAFASPMTTMDMTAMTQADMSAMPDCMVSLTKDVTRKPCKCGLVGCITMMATGASFMPVDGVVTPGAVIAKERPGRAPRAAELRGRTTAPEPEPPTLLG